jgi:hypothetical protein
MHLCIEREIANERTLQVREYIQSVEKLIAEGI